MKTLQTAVGELVCWSADDITRSLEAGEFWDAHLKEAFDQTPGDGWAIDLGANIGFFSLYLAERFERVVAVEAHPETANLLYRNVMANGQGHKVLVISAAAYDRHTTLELATTAIHGWVEPERSFLDTDSVPHSGGYTFVEDPSQQHHLHEIKVPTVVLDEIIPETAQIRLLKVDVQGAALRALHGCDRLIARCRPRIVFEFEGHVSECRGNPWQAYVDFFNERQYDTFSILGPWQDFLAVPR